MYKGRGRSKRRVGLRRFAADQDVEPVARFGHAVARSGQIQLSAFYAAQPLVGLGNPRQGSETEGQTYVVNKGDTLHGIAKAFGVTTKALVDMNRSKVQTWPTSTGKKIQGFNAGQTIIIPGGGAPEAAAESEESFVTGITQRIKSVGAAVRNKVKTFWDKATSFWSAGVSFWDKAMDSLVGESGSLAEIEKTA